MKTAKLFLNRSNAGSAAALRRALLCLVLLVLPCSIFGGCAPVNKGNSSPRATPSVGSQPCSVTVHEFLFPSPFLNPGPITPGSDGTLWVYEYDPTTTQGHPKDDFLGRWNPRGFQHFPVPFSLFSLVALAAGPAGNLWYIRIGKVGRMTPTGQVHEFPLPHANSNVGGITQGPDGNLWFTESEQDQQHPQARIGRVTPSGTLQEFPVPTRNSYPAGITMGLDGNLWFTESDEIGDQVAKIGRMTPDGVVSEFPLAIPQSRLNKIIAGPDGNLWFPEVTSDDGETPIGTIGRISPQGVIREFALPSSSAERHHHRPRWQSLVHRSPPAWTGDAHRNDHRVLDAPDQRSGPGRRHARTRWSSLGIGLWSPGRVYRAGGLIPCCPFLVTPSISQRVLFALKDNIMVRMKGFFSMKHSYTASRKPSSAFQPPWFLRLDVLGLAFSSLALLSFGSFLFLLFKPELTFFVHRFLASTGVLSFLFSLTSLIFSIRALIGPPLRSARERIFVSISFLFASPILLLSSLFVFISLLLLFGP